VQFDSSINQEIEKKRANDSKIEKQQMLKELGFEDAEAKMMVTNSSKLQVS
jgi:hypothetical protein